MYFKQVGNQVHQGILYPKNNYTTILFYSSSLNDSSDNIAFKFLFNMNSTSLHTEVCLVPISFF